MDHLQEPEAEKAHRCGIQEMAKLQLTQFMHPLSQNQFLKRRAAANFSCGLKDPVTAKPRLQLKRPIPATERSLRQQKTGFLSRATQKARAYVLF